MKSINQLAKEFDEAKKDLGEVEYFGVPDEGINKINDQIGLIDRANKYYKYIDNNGIIENSDVLCR